MCTNASSCARQRRPISRMWSTEMRWRGNSWCGHNWVTGSAVTSTPLLSPTSAPHLPSAVRGRGGICYGEKLTALMHISLTATIPAVTIRKEHMPELGTTSEELLHSRSLFFVTYSTHLMCAFEVIVTVG